MKNACSSWVVAMVVTLANCQKKSEPPEATTAPAAVSVAAPVIPARKGSAQAGLDGLDARTPVPLLPMMAHHQKQNMRDHLAAVQEIVAAVAKSDFLAVEKAAGRIGFSEAMGRMCTHMGAAAPGFAESALEFHHQADKIGEAARARDAASVLAALGQTLSRCTGCHATYKQHVVDEAEWSAAAAGAAGPRGHVD